VLTCDTSYDAASAAAASPAVLATSSYTEAFESSETEIENYCLLRAEILLSISAPGVRYLFHSSHFSLARAGSALHTCVFVTRRVQSDSACLLARL
jgi:hypothetical protein